MKRFWVVPLLLFHTSLALADKVIMKDGKIYEGRIMGETQRSILITTPRGGEPKFLSLADVMTIVREKNPDVPSPDRDCHVHIEALVTGNFFSSDAMSLSAAPGLAVNGGFRLHPLVQVEGGMDWDPSISGSLAVFDGSTFRRYEHFYRYSGGFGLRLFPFYRFKALPFESYILGGYRWVRLVPKDSGDYLKGKAWQAGLGVAKPLWRDVYLEFRVLYEHTTYDTINFLSRDGTLNPGIGVSSWSLQSGISWRL